MKVVTPPRAPARPRAATLHGVEIIDDFAWIRAENWRDVLRDPRSLPTELRQHLEAENAYAEARLEPFAGLRSALAREMRGRIREDDSSPPVPDGAWAYYRRYRTGGEHALVCRRRRGGGEESMLLDGDAQAAGCEFFELGSAEPSPDHRRLAWSADVAGSEFYTIHVRDLENGEDGDRVTDAEGGVVWTADSSAFYYVRLDDEHRPSRVFRHRLGEPAERDELVFEEPNPAFFVDVERSLSGRFAFIDSSDHESSEIHVLDLTQAQSVPRLIASREPSMRYEAEHWGDAFVILTNADQALDFKLVLAPLDAPGRENWRDLVAHRPGVMIVAQAAFEGHHVRLEREDGLPRIVVRDGASGAEHAIAFEEEAYSLSLRRLREYGSRSLRFAYSSMTTPEEIYDYDMTTRERRLVKRQEIPSGHDPRAYVTRRLFARAADGERVPVSLLYRRDTPIDGRAPTLLYGYGAYGDALPANFRSTRLSLVDRGFVYAIAHVRGGSERGERWRIDGKLAKKRNSFTDYLAVAHSLIDQRFTSAGRIIGEGGSAGGLLVGAAVNMEPGLFAGIIGDVPFVDVLNTMLDADLPLTPPEWLEWGDPISDRAAFETIRSYSPYDNVRAQAYPPMLILAGLTDPRVPYWEPAKWAARLRARMTGGGPILLKTNMQAGHGGAPGRFQALDEIALGYAFALACASGELPP